MELRTGDRSLHLYSAMRNFVLSAKTLFELAGSLEIQDAVKYFLFLVGLMGVVLAPTGTSRNGGGIGDKILLLNDNIYCN